MPTETGHGRKVLLRTTQGRIYLLVPLELIRDSTNHLAGYRLLRILSLRDISIL
jgi:hypothetical protein